MTAANTTTPRGESWDSTWSDFGRVATGIAIDVARPTTTQEVVEVVQQARSEPRTKLTLRANGLSQSGQSVPIESRILSTTALSYVRDPNLAHRTITCGAGAPIRAVLARALEHGFVPRVMPINLDLSVGGVLCAGGFGPTSHRWGPMAAQITSAKVVLGTGQVVMAGPGINRAVYDAVFGGVGRCGVITEVELCLEPVVRQLRVFHLVYDDVRSFIQDGLEIGAYAYQLEAACFTSTRASMSVPKDLRPTWFYRIEISIPCEDNSADLVLERLRHRLVQPDVHYTFSSFIARCDARLQQMRESGAWDLAHPWFEVFVPLDSAEVFIPRALALLPSDYTESVRIGFLADSDHPRALALPHSKGLIFALLPQGIPASSLPRWLEAIRDIDLLAAQFGGKRYLSGYLFDKQNSFWRDHYGEDCKTLVNAKRAFDPEGIFHSALSQP